jgi:hypothetical protein
MITSGVRQSRIPEAGRRSPDIAVMEIPRS